MSAIPSTARQECSCHDDFRIFDSGQGKETSSNQRNSYGSDWVILEEGGNSAAIWSLGLKH